MDILTHALSGAVVASCTCAFIKAKGSDEIKILSIGVLGGILPDVDAISMWSGFDNTLGQLFSLSKTGKQIYSDKLWYSHHAFFHSLLASIIFGIVIFIIIFSFRFFKDKQQINLRNFLKRYLIYPLTFIFGYLAHLAGDLPTPSGSWGGISFLFPSSKYIGGYGKIWWWNNYDIFLILLICLFCNLLLLLLFRKKNKRIKILITSATCCFSLFLIISQINSREYDYSDRKKYTELEKNSKKEQERILGKRIYNYMEYFDKSLKIYF